MATLMLACVQTATAAPFDQVTGIMVPAPSVDTQNGKLHTGTASACSPAKVVPAVDPGTFNFVGFSEPSAINEPACVTVSITTTDSTCWTNGLFSASYLGSFDNTNVQANYVGDVGAGPTSATPVAYSMVVPPGQVLDTLFNTSSPGTGCPSFDVTWSSDRPWAVSRPRISGHPFAGETVTAVDGVWSAGTLTRQWRRCALDGSSCADIPGATGTTYAVAPDDVGHALVLHVAATDSGMTSTSDGRPVVAGVQFDALNGQSISGTEPTQQGRLALNLVPSTCASPRAAGNAVDTAHTRSYDVFTHTNQSESTLCTIASLDTTTACTGSGGATSAAYLPTYQPGAVRTNYLGDTGAGVASGGRNLSYSFNVPAGASYDVVVTTVNTGVTCPAYDLRLGATAPSPLSAPTVQGTARDGQTLTSTDGTWTGTPSFAHQWLRCFADGSGCSDAAGATGATYPLTPADVGHSYRVRVTATEGAGSAAKTSAPSPPVESNPPAPYAGIALKRSTVAVRRNGVVTLTLSCPADAMLACAGTDTLKLGKQKLGSRSFLIFNGEKAKLRFTLSKKFRKQLARKKKLKATQTVVSRDARRLPVTTSAPLTLKFKKP